MEIKCAFKEMVPIVKLVEHPRNPNKHPDKQVQMLAKIIKYHGWRHPIIVSKRSGFIVAGHGRLMAARELGLENVPVDYQDFESEAAEFQFLVADNKIAELAESDDLKMIEEIKDLGLQDLNFELLGLEDFSLESPFELQMGKNEKNHQDFFDEWLKKDAKRICFVFEHQDFEIFQSKMKELKKKFDCQTDADLLLLLVNKIENL
jgi:hypothetical protein